MFLTVPSKCFDPKRERIPELIQKTAEDLSTPEAWLGFQLTMLGSFVREETDRALERVGINARAVGFMLALADTPNVGQTQLRRRLRLDRTTMSQLVDVLARDGLLIRGVDPGDRRSSQLKLTRKGRERLGAAVAAGRKVEEGLLAHVSDAEALELKRILLVLLRFANGEEQSDAIG